MTEYTAGMKFIVPLNAEALFMGEGGPGWLPRMNKFIGKVVTLKHCTNPSGIHHLGGNFKHSVWHIEEDLDEHVWSPELLQKLDMAEISYSGEWDVL